MHSRDHLPPQDLWPTILRTAPELQYPQRLNLATVLLDEHAALDAVSKELAERRFSGFDDQMLVFDLKLNNRMIPP